MQLAIRFLNWLHGWRTDHEGWWVRAERKFDQHFIEKLQINGFTCDCATVVKFPEEARALDKALDEAAAVS